MESRLISAMVTGGGCFLRSTGRSGSRTPKISSATDAAAGNTANQNTVRKLSAKMKLPRVVLCGRKDAALVVSLTAAIEPAVERIAVEEMLLSYRVLFDEIGRPINAASIVPGMLRDYGDTEAADTAKKRLAELKKG